MDWTKLKPKWETSIRYCWLLSVSNIVLVVALAIVSVYITRQHERIVLVPPHLDERAEVGFNAADERYYKSFGLYAATLIGSITPRNVEFVSDAISGFTSPALYADLRSRIMALADDPAFKGSLDASYFACRSLLFEPTTSRVFAIGENVQSGYRTEKKKNVVYEMQIVMEHGLPVFQAFSVYEGTQPHTLKWQETQQLQGKEQEQEAAR